MKSRIIAVLATGLAMLALLTSTTGVTRASVDDKTQPAQTGTPSRSLDDVSSGFTYQGSLKDEGNPANGQYDMQFTLYDALTGGNQVGAPVTISSQTVNNGLFSAQLDFGPSAFQGSSRWLEIAVRPAGGGTYTTLSPRQELTPAPYAMGLVPGAVVAGSVPTGTAALSGRSTGAGNGVYGDSAGTDSSGVVGVADNGSNARGVAGTSANGTGVYGSSNGTNQGGVVGEDDAGFGLVGSGYTGVSGNGYLGDGVRGVTTFGAGGSFTSVFGNGLLGQSNNGDGVRGHSDTAFGGDFSSGSSYGVYAQSDHEAAGVFSSTTSYGVVGRTVVSPAGVFSSTSGYGVEGLSDSASAVVGASNSGLGGTFSSNTNAGVYASSGSGIAVYGVSNGAATGYFVNDGGNGLFASSNHSHAIVGAATYTGTAGIDGYNYLGYGVWGTGRTGVYGSSTAGDGVAGESTSGLGGDFGSVTNSAIQGLNQSSQPSILGINASSGDGVQGFSSGTGVSGISTGGSSGVYGTSTGGYGVYGVAQATNGGGTVGEDTSGFGVIGNGYTGVSGTGTQGDGVRGHTGLGSGGNFSSDSGYGVFAESDNQAAGVFSSTNSYGLYARTVLAPAGVFSSTSGLGVKGQSSTGIGVVGDSTVSVGGDFRGAGDSVVGEDPTSHCGACYAGYFGYNVDVNGTLFANSKAFKIDDPADPANKYLIHTSVESPDMLDIYRGHVTLDAQGTAWVQMPDYFQALNMDFDYQLTPVGASQPNLYVAQEIKDNKFQIAGGVPGAKVSWQVTGVRHDPYAEANRTPVEQTKSPQEQGLYLDPELYNQPASKGINSLYSQDNTQQTLPPPTTTGNK